jgi:hypothetical protein
MYLTWAETILREEACRQGKAKQLVKLKFRRNQE